MDAFESFHPVPAAWLRDSDLAPFIPAYVRRLVDRHYAASTVRMYVYAWRTSRTGRAAIGSICETLLMRLSGASLTNICRTAPAYLQCSAAAIRFEPHYASC